MSNILPIHFIYKIDPSYNKKKEIQQNAIYIFKIIII